MIPEPPVDCWIQNKSLVCCTFVHRAVWRVARSLVTLCCGCVGVAVGRFIHNNSCFFFYSTFVIVSMHSVYIFQTRVCLVHLVLGCFCLSSVQHFLLFSIHSDFRLGNGSSDDNDGREGLQQCRISHNKMLSTLQFFFGSRRSKSSQSVCNTRI